VTDSTFQVDLTNCDSEPIHILGTIQPFGFLLALTPEWLIARVSANAADYLGRQPEALLGKPLTDLLEPDAIHSIRNRMTLLRGEDAVERLFGLRLTSDGPRYDVAIHMTEGMIVLEAEPAPELPEGDPTGTIRAMMTRLDQAEQIEAFFREGARQVRALTGFDRVMVYKFDHTGSGEVVAEAARSGIGSFLGLHYPASDIPAQARALYIRNIFRVIADVGATPVPVLPALDNRGRPLDLSLAVQRSVSPIHIEYLTNMGVGASLSISIVVDGKLWGLFACHHYSPRLPPLERRAVCELFGQMFAMKLESRERLATAEYLRGARDVSDRLLGSVASNAAVLEDADLLAETIGSAIASDGIGVCIDGKLTLAGLTPPIESFRKLVRTLNAQGAKGIISSSRIAEIDPSAVDYAETAAGMLAIPISRIPRDYVILFRQEIVQTVRWGGDPTKPVSYGPNGPRLTPRKSFEAWSELVRGSSQPFSTAELRVAETLRTTLIEVVLRMSHEAHAERQLANERQQLLIAELNHRVRNILSLIRGLIRQSDSSGSIDDYVADIDGRIQALARAHNQITSENWGIASLRTLITTESAAYLGDSAGRVAMRGPEVGLSPQGFSTIALVIHELITNSAKYGGLSNSGRVEVDWRLDDDNDLLLDWREIGGPVVQAPTRQGFGTTIIRRSIPFDLGGRADVHYSPAGFNAHFCIPSKHVVPATAEHAAASEAALAMQTKDIADHGKPLNGKTVLLVEDSLIIAMDAEDILLQLGAKRVISAATVRNAIEEIDREKPEMAILDVNLGDQTSLPIAEHLLAAGTPFIFATGYGEQVGMSDLLAQIAVVQKPYSAESIATALQALPGKPVDT